MVQVFKSIEKKGRKRMVTESTKMTLLICYTLAPPLSENAALQNFRKLGVGKVVWPLKLTWRTCTLAERFFLFWPRSVDLSGYSLVFESTRHWRQIDASRLKLTVCKTIFIKDPAVQMQSRERTVCWQRLRIICRYFFNSISIKVYQMILHSQWHQCIAHCTLPHHNVHTHLKK